MTACLSQLWQFIFCRLDRRGYNVWYWKSTLAHSLCVAYPQIIITNNLYSYVDSNMRLTRLVTGTVSSQQWQHGVWGAGQLVTTRCFSRRSTRHTILGCDELTVDELTGTPTHRPSLTEHFTDQVGRWNFQWYRAESIMNYELWTMKPNANSDDHCLLSNWKRAARILIIPQGRIYS